MNKNISLQTLIQNFLSEDELQAILKEFDYVETARKCTVSVLISYLVTTAVKEWKSLRYSTDLDASVSLVSFCFSFERQYQIKSKKSVERQSYQGVQCSASKK